MTQVIQEVLIGVWRTNATGRIQVSWDQASGTVGEILDRERLTCSLEQLLGVSACAA